MGLSAASFSSTKSAWPLPGGVVRGQTEARHAPPMALWHDVAHHCYRETRLLLQTTVLLANLINDLHILWSVLNHSSSCIELNLGPTFLTTEGGTFSIIIDIVSPKWFIIVAYFKYLRANLGGRSHTNRGGNIESISLKSIGRTSDGEGIWPLGRLQI